MSQIIVMLITPNLQKPARNLILKYFESLNAGLFDSVSELFVDDGYLYPPFDRAIQGRKQIRDYLEKEFKNFCARPQEILEQSDQLEYLVYGEVETSLFSVKVSWVFKLNSQNKFKSVSIKLLASLKELINLAPMETKKILSR